MRPSSNEIPKSLAVMGSAVASGVVVALILSTAPLLGRQAGPALAAGTECTGGESSPSPTSTSTGTPLPIPTLPIPTGSATPSPSGSGTPSPTPSASEPPDAPAPATTTPQNSPTPGATPSESPASSPPPGATQQCQSKITISYASNRQRFSGEVRSDKRACEAGRRVMLKRDRRSGKDRTVATTVTGRNGGWRLPLPDRSGRRFYARTPRQEVSSEQGQIVCLGDRSRTISTKNPL